MKPGSADLASERVRRVFPAHPSGSAGNFNLDDTIGGMWRSLATVLARRDHLFPRVLKTFKVADPIDGIWNLVLACQGCNRGAKGKFDCLPELSYLERLHKRNE